jgi:hypothetical protein
MSAKLICDICGSDEVDQRKRINFIGLQDVCKECEDTLYQTIDLMKASPWGRQVAKIHKQFFTGRISDANDD